MDPKLDLISQLKLIRHDVWNIQNSAEKDFDSAKYQVDRSATLVLARVDGLLTGLLVGQEDS